MFEKKDVNSGSMGGVSPHKKGVMVYLDADLVYSAKKKHRGFISWAAERGIRAALVHYEQVERDYFPEIPKKVSPETPSKRGWFK